MLAWDQGGVFAEQMSAQESRQVLAHAFSRHLSSSPKLTFEFDSTLARGAETLALRNARARERENREATARIREHPNVAQAVEILRARIKEIRLAD